MNANSSATFAGGGGRGPRSDEPIAIELRGITKRFPGVVANDRVDLVVHSGDIHAIVGENGSGKSTLMKTLYGQLRPDAGTITVIFISHKLDEVLAISDAITVIRAGRTVATVKGGDVNAGQLAELMIGSELPTPETTGLTIRPETELELSHITVRTPEGRALLDDVSLSVHRGEVVGVAG